MTSWTKIWSCTGIRLGSVVAPNPEALLELKAKQVPWSVNCVALVRANLNQDVRLFLSRVMKDIVRLRNLFAVHILNSSFAAPDNLLFRRFGRDGWARVAFDVL